MDFKMAFLWAIFFTCVGGVLTHRLSPKGTSFSWKIHTTQKKNRRNPTKNFSRGSVLFLGGFFYMLVASQGGLGFMFFSFLLWALSVFDIQKGILPDFLLTFLGLCYLQQTDFKFSLQDISQAGVFFLLAFFLKIGYYMLKRKNGLGWGDIKFFSISGLWLDLAQTSSFLFLTGVGGLCLGLFWRYYLKEETFPLGPSIAFSLWVHVGWVI